MGIRGGRAGIRGGRAGIRRKRWVGGYKGRGNSAPRIYHDFSMKY